MSKASIQEFVRCVTMDEISLFSYISSTLRSLNYEVFEADDYIYANGDIPIMLIAHTDTVHDREPTLKELIHIKTHNAITSEVGLGADDRAGISAIMYLLKQGFKPHVLFCTGEEVGGIGARAAAKDIGNSMSEENINLLIEVDRRGFNEFVTYSCENPIMDDYMFTFGLKKEIGSFSDISILAPAFGIGAVNMSIGYYGEHTKKEYLLLDEYNKTIDTLKSILENPPKSKFDYIAKKSSRYYGSLYDDLHDDTYSQSYNTKYYQEEEYEIIIRTYELEDIAADVDWVSLFDNEYNEVEALMRKAALEALSKSDLLKYYREKRE